MTGTALGWGTTSWLAAVTAGDELVLGTTAVTVVPPVTIAVVFNVVLTAADDDWGVLDAPDSVGSGTPEVGLLDGVGLAGTTAPVVTAALAGVVAAGAGVEVVAVALGTDTAVVAPWVVVGGTVVSIAARGAWVVTGFSVVGATVGVYAGTVRVGVSTGGGV
ncbi:hypothetical protein [Mycobacterium sp.]|uniref:hypothetical protein n=1 Tax=Mycobacterium sp. TaxID=1785 RepID=UPI003341C811